MRLRILLVAVATLGLSYLPFPVPVAAAPARPAPTLQPRPNAAGWNTDTVAVGLSGGAGTRSITYSSTGAQGIPSTTVTGASATLQVTGEGVTTVSFFATDGSGNRSATGTQVVRIDRETPIITITSPDPNAQYVAGPGSNTTAQYTCSDPVSGIASCTGNVPNGAIIDMSQAGFFTFTVNAVSVAGTTSSKSVPYTILFGE
jgi:hypothetical protein